MKPEHFRDIEKVPSCATCAHNSAYEHTYIKCEKHDFFLYNYYSFEHVCDDYLNDDEVIRKIGEEK